MVGGAVLQVLFGLRNPPLLFSRLLVSVHVPLFMSDRFSVLCCQRALTVPCQYVSAALCQNKADSIPTATLLPLLTMCNTLNVVVFDELLACTLHPPTVEVNEVSWFHCGVCVCSGQC